MLGGALGVALSEPAYAILMVERVGFCPDPTNHLKNNNFSATGCNGCDSRL